MVKAYSYQIIPGFFIQDDVSSVPEHVEAVPPRFGLLDTSSERWSTFKSSIADLAKDVGEEASVKVIFFGRHGQGYHNVAEEKYGTKAWDDHWAKLNGDGEIVWGPDPKLTEIGREQAQDAHQAWRTEIAFNIPLPEKLYCSPLSRAIETNQITFNKIIDQSNRTTIVENCREMFADHTCDKRSTRTYIANTFPDFVIEDGFSEEDLLWPGNVENGETAHDVAVRAKKVLDKIYNEDEATYISITGHGGIINGFLVALGTKPFALPTGGVLALVVKAVTGDPQL